VVGRWDALDQHTVGATSINMNFISPNRAAQYNVERKIEIQNIQVIQKKVTLYKKSKLIIGFNKRNNAFKGKL